jgi:hypothetical protein
MEMWLGGQWHVTRASQRVRSEAHGCSYSTLNVAIRMPYIRSCLVQLFLDSEIRYLLTRS